MYQIFVFGQQIRYRAVVLLMFIPAPCVRRVMVLCRMDEVKRVTPVVLLSG
ncbi:hypothetical protein [uncultured Duncaniella sp.]|uniref:hypothetical protein n=1 Tax=uncultured Duncaniella sp. TaxID=2768039 RepID=UPI00345CF6D8